jgi:glucoamylase
MSGNSKNAPGWPGIPPRWTSSAKSGVGTSLTRTSRVWFTLSHGIVNEVYYPRLDQACTRDMGLIVTDGRDFFSEEKRHTKHEVSYLADGVPAYRLVNTCAQGRYRIEKEILTDPLRTTLLQYVTFVPLKGKMENYRLYALLAPHLGNCGSCNTAWTGDYKGTPLLCAVNADKALALACSAPWRKRSAGFVGFSDGWQDLDRHKHMTAEHARAENGNVALTGEVDLQQCGGTFVMSLGFGQNAMEAGHYALASLLEGFEPARDEYVRQWRLWQNSLPDLNEVKVGDKNLQRISMAVIRTHEAKQFTGGIIASLSIPWGFAKGDNDLGGYHLVWPRDLEEVAGGLLAAGAHEDAHRVIHYLETTQEADGHWSQNMFMDGTPYWGGVQMDEVGFPILLVDLARREKAIGEHELINLWPMVRRAAGYLARHGPVTEQDRWEENAGYSPFTLAVEIAAALAAADLAEHIGEKAMAHYLRETADVWNSQIERWTYVTDTDLSRQIGVEGYYVRIAPPELACAASPLHGNVPIKNRPAEHTHVPAAHVISPDALALVRFGLRAANDPRIVNTVKVIDALLKVDTPYGPCWRRYNGDGYGEHEDGSPFDGTGIGRAWPLLTGERAFYELAAGRKDEAKKLLRAFEAFANESGLFPEQIWDAPDIPAHGLFSGRPAGSAMPLVWAHAEYIKLVRSIHDGCVFDLPPQTVARYLKKKCGSPHAIWRFDTQCGLVPTGKTLRVETLAPAVVHWSDDRWSTTHDTNTSDTGLGVHVANLPTEALGVGSRIAFTFFWPEVGRWEGENFVAVIRAD